MKFYKRIFSSLAIFVLILTFSACGNSAEDNGNTVPVELWGTWKGESDQYMTLTFTANSMIETDSVPSYGGSATITNLIFTPTTNIKEDTKYDYSLGYTVTGKITDATGSYSSSIGINTYTVLFLDDAGDKFSLFGETNMIFAKQQ